MVSTKLTNSEMRVQQSYLERGYKSLREGSPDFVFYKTDSDNNIKDVLFVEVKTNGDHLRANQALYAKILRSVGARYKLENVNLAKDYDLVRVSERTYKKLLSIGKKGDSFNDVITILLDGVRG